jgi:signal peptidase I
MQDGFMADAAPGNRDSDGRITPLDQDDTQPITVPLARSESRSHSAAWEIVETLLLAVLIFFAVRLVVLNFRVDGLSMEPTLDTGQMLLVNRQVYFHFDVYALVDWLPIVDHEKERIVYPFHPPQRGDIVVLHPPVDQGKPYIKRVIGLPGELFVMGDNRGNSTDSRIFGAVDIDELIGKAWISYWPSDKFDVLTTPSYGD